MTALARHVLGLDELGKRRGLEDFAALAAGGDLDCEVEVVAKVVGFDDWVIPGVGAVDVYGAAGKDDEVPGVDAYSARFLGSVTKKTSAAGSEARKRLSTWALRMISVAEALVTRPLASRSSVWVDRFEMTVSYISMLFCSPPKS